MEALNEIIQFLDVNARLDLKQVSLTHVLSESLNILYLCI